MIVDDHPAVREALDDLLRSMDIETASFASAGAMLDASIPDRPGCLILDVRMPGGSGLELQRELARRRDGRPIIFLTGHADVEMAVNAMKAGAIDFLLKPFREQDLLDAVAAGIERDVARRANATVARQGLELLSTLTPRERQVLAEVARGRLNKQIAFDLGISEVTVKLHRSQVMRKMRATSLGDLVRTWQILLPHVREEQAGQLFMGEFRLETDLRQRAVA
ncbi:response regulator transcription factor [Sphingomonas sp. JC676]|uniref:response regulator transcription factor n=1 Tax=Sphingomonas sp. JC676 TaxID=2768065 RepID=UPI00292A506D|nr:response regulator transcription factor [Sphingomonas sp. JC676]